MLSDSSSYRNACPRRIFGAVHGRCCMKVLIVFAHPEPRSLNVAQTVSMSRDG